MILLLDTDLTFEYVLAIFVLDYRTIIHPIIIL